VNFVASELDFVKLLVGHFDSGLAADPFVGTWKPDLTQWKLSPGAPEDRKHQVITFELAGQNQYREIISTVDGSPTDSPLLIWIWDVDGNEHLDPVGLRVRIEHVDDRHLRQTAKGPKGTSVWDFVVSADSTTLTVVRKGTGTTSSCTLDELLLYQRQPTKDPFMGTWELDIAGSRIDNPKILKRMEMTFTEQDGDLAWADVQYRIDGRVLRRTHLLRFDQVEHPNPNAPGTQTAVRRLDATTIERVSTANGKVAAVVIDALLPDGKTLLQFVHAFNPDGSLLSDETQAWHRR